MEGGAHKQLWHALKDMFVSKSINTLNTIINKLPEFKFCEVYWHIFEHDRHTAKGRNRIHTKQFHGDGEAFKCYNKTYENTWLRKPWIKDTSRVYGTINQVTISLIQETLVPILSV